MKGSNKMRVRDLKIIKSTPIKRVGKHDRERRVLLGLVDYYIQTGKPVGSNTLKESGFEDLSSATIRNYFAQLEEEGYLIQSHSSGGRIPTDLAYRVYAHDYLNSSDPYNEHNPFEHFKKFDSKEITTFLQETAETLSHETNCAIFLSAPRFDHDFIANLKLVPIDTYRCLCVIMTDFGVIKTEVMHLPIKLSSFAIKRIENYFHWRLTNLGEPENLDSEEEAIAQTFYNELMLRYIVGYSNFIDVDLHRTGFSRLLSYPDFQETELLASSLSLFENAHSMRLLLKECKTLNQLRFWIGDDLTVFANSSPQCSVLTIPYFINTKPVGAIGLLGPTRLPYRKLFSLLRLFSETISETVTKNVYKFKIDYRQPEQSVYLQKEENLMIGQSRLLIEDKRSSMCQ
jgi:heat-inducible transcriptional repressor